MLGLGNGIPTGSAGDQLLVSYVDTIQVSPAASTDGWSYWSFDGSVSTPSASGNMENGDEGKLLLAFLSNQTSDTGFFKNMTSNGVSGDYMVVSYEISVGVNASKWGDGSSGNDIPVRTKWGGVTSSATNVAITDHSAGLVTISETITATGSYSSGEDNALIVAFLASDNELPLAGASAYLQNIRAHVYRPI
tara:strand:+ start:792 stop:1367 length:576 start_codon:yes stop_codon:yes gene_type:complete